MKSILTLLLFIGAIQAQVLKVEYKKLQSPLFPEESPVISILEKDNSLFDALGQYPKFTNKFTCYSSEVISGLKEALQVEEFSAADRKFQTALREQLSVAYILDWKSIPDSTDAFQLDIYSTSDGSRIYSGHFYKAGDSQPTEDVKKLIVDNLQASYSFPTGELVVKVNPSSARFRMIKGQELVKEWSGADTQKIVAGKYRLITDAERYITDERDVEIIEGQTVNITIDLKPDYSSFLKIISAVPQISNIRADFSGPQMKITYDLNKSDYNIFLEMDSGENSSRPALMISGDTRQVKQGMNKVIYWDIQKELGNVPMKELQLELTAQKVGGWPWYYYAGGGAVLLGGAAALVLGGGGGNGGNNNPTAVKIGTPPGRP